MMAADKAWTAAAASGTSTSMSAASVAVITRTSSSAGRRGGRQQGSRSASQTTTLTLCSFHKKFGDAARKYAPGCSCWSEDRPRDTPATRCLPRRGVPRWRGCRRGNGFGKLLGWSPRAAGQPTRARPAQLGLVLDKLTRHQWLLDTGSQVSIWPPSPSTARFSLSKVRLAAANGTPIKAFGQQKRKIKIGGESYTFVFLIVQVSKPILGLDFLQKFKMSMDLSNRRLLHFGKVTRFSSTSSAVSGVNVVQTSPFACLLDDFPEITDVSLASSSSKHRIECFINTTGPPIKTSPRRLTPEKLRSAKQYFEVICAAGICRWSSSPWSSGLHMVPKKDGTSRPCGDYRHLNKHTTGDAYPIPHIHDFAADLVGCKIFSKIDQVKGYHQVLAREQDVPKTAIATPFGLFEFVRMQFGLKNSAQTFQRLMDSVTGQLKGVFAYIDDVLVASPTAEQHKRDLKQLFSALWCFGLVLNSSKCEFGVRSIEFLGHRVSAQGIQPLPNKVEAVRCFERPSWVKALQRFLGMVNFYRRFLPNVAAIMRKLTDALAGAPRQLEWNEALTSAFVKTKECLAKATLLFHPIADAELHVNTDASSKAIAGEIHQVVGGHLQPLGFFSRRTTPAEYRYSAYDLELLAVYSTIVKFRHALEGRCFRIYTDQKPLTSNFFKARDPLSNRQWQQLTPIIELATDVAHVPGLENVVLDALSRQYDD